MNIKDLVTCKQRFTDPYRWLIVALGVIAFLSSASRVNVESIDLRFLFLVAMTVIASSSLAVQIPRFDTNITVSDTFIFLTLLLYGGEPAILLAAAEGVCSGLRVSKTKRPVTILFSAATMTCSTFATVWILRFAFGSITEIPHQGIPVVIAAVCSMALIEYLSNTGLVALGLACKTDQHIWQTWSRNYLWSSITYFAGAAAAGLIVMTNDMVGIYALMVTIPVILIVYFTYSKYLEDIKATAAQAERAERERAEAEHARAEAERLRAEQAERHVEELKESREHFRHAAFHDALTGLPNRSLFTEHLRVALGRTRQHEGYLFCVLFLDLDRFKNINDSLGHTWGDELLILVARRLEACIRQTDMVARFGGDEFAILLDAIADSSDAIRVAEKVQQAISAPFKLHNHEAVTTASIGVAFGALNYTEAEDMIRDADTAMYRAKDHGKARYEIFDTAMHARAVTLLRMESDLRRAVEKQEVCVYYQPILSVASGELHGFEALVRWQHPERGMVSPNDFIQLAEETGLILPLGLSVLREACWQMRTWQQRSLSDRNLTISVNLSGKQLTQPDLIEKIEEVLIESGLDPSHLTLEITESVVMENAEMAAVTLAKLRRLGVGLSIDDFGTGYSSLSYLSRFPVDTLKIDRSFITRICQGDENLEIVKTVLILAHNLGMQVVAEGVETEEQLSQLRLLKCQYAQGYLLSKPMDATDAEMFILNGPKTLEYDRARLGLEVPELAGMSLTV